MTQHTMSNGGGFQLDPALKQYMQQQRTRAFFDKIGLIGQGIMAASSRGASFGNALAQGVSYAAGSYGRGRGPGRGGGGLLDVLDMQRNINAARSSQKKRQADRQRQSD